NPLLSPLASNGGPTQTHALLSGSPALDAGDNTGTSTTSIDQRGYTRSFNGRQDIGAYEAQRLSLFVVNTNDNGPGSLRQAIADADANPNFNSTLDTVSFNVPSSDPNCKPAAPHVCTISLLSALPVVTDPVIIDGYTQPGASMNTLAVGDNAVLTIEL